MGQLTEYVQSSYLPSTILSSISNNLALNSPSLTFNILDSGIFSPYSTNILCLGLIFLSRLNEKNCGNFLNSSKSPFISLTE